AHGPVVAQPMLESPADGAAAGIVAVPVRVADESAGVELAVGIVEYRAFVWKKLRGRAGLVVLPKGHQGQGSTMRWPPGDRRREHQAVVGYVVDHGVRLAAQRDHTVKPLAVFVDGARQVGLNLAPVVRAVLNADLERRFGLRALRDHVEYASGADQ